MSIVLCIILFAIISVITIGSAQQLLDESSNLVIKQITQNKNEFAKKKKKLFGGFFLLIIHVFLKKLIDLI